MASLESEYGITTYSYCDVILYYDIIDSTVMFLHLRGNDGCLQTHFKWDFEHFRAYLQG